MTGKGYHHPPEYNQVLSALRHSPDIIVVSEPTESPSNESPYGGPGIDEVFWIQIRPASPDGNRRRNEGGDLPQDAPLSTAAGLLEEKVQGIRHEGRTLLMDFRCPEQNETALFDRVVISQGHPTKIIQPHKPPVLGDAPSSF